MDASSIKTQVVATDIPFILDKHGADLKVLSLDCFDTLLWRKTALPKDVFYAMQHKPLLQTLGVTAYQRMASAARAYRAKAIAENCHQVSLTEIYQAFSSLSEDEKNSLVEEELKTEIEICYAFPPCVELIRKAIERGIKVVIVSDFYLPAAKLKELLVQHLPADVMNNIAHIYTSLDHGLSKKDGLFTKVIQHLNVSPAEVLHLGDHEIADHDAPAKLGIRALHFLQFDEKVARFLKMQNMAASLAILSRPVTTYAREARYSPFKGVYSLQNPFPATPEALIGYMTFGPILYAFSRFVSDEIETIKSSSKKVKVFFLLRDAYLLYRACEAYAGEPMGELARIRKFVAVAASFRTREDIDYYISSIKPEHYNTWVICEQLLLPHDMIMKIHQEFERSQNQQETFLKLLHEPDTMQLIFSNSAETRKRLIKYLTHELHVEAGDTIVLVDTGYHGVTQEYLIRSLKGELNVEVTGLYFIASHEPDRPACKSLFTSTWCEHGLFEQSCTYKEGAVTGYAEDGKPTFDNLKLSDRQYQKVQAIQDEVVSFIRDAKQLFARAAMSLPFEMLQSAAESALIRHIFFPTPEELHYFSDFQHDKDMGPDRTKTMYNISQALQNHRQLPTWFRSHPYEERALNLDISLSSLMQRAYDLDMLQEDKSYIREPVEVVLLKGDQYEKIDAQAIKTTDGYFSLVLNTPVNCHLGIVFGRRYEWIQIEHVALLNNASVNFLNDEKLFIPNKMKRFNNIFECESSESYVMLPALRNDNQIASYQVIFRPLTYRPTLNNTGMSA